MKDQLKSDFLSEPALSAREAAKLKLLQRDGRQPHFTNVIRWWTKGARDAGGNRVVLERKRLPTGYVTSEAAVRRFLLRLDGRDPAADAAATSGRVQAVQTAEREMAAAGLL
jgi:hypothetical protein